MLVSGLPFERLEAAVVARAIADNHIVDALMECLHDDNADRITLDDGGFVVKRVCDVAAEALTHIGTPEALVAVQK